MTCGCNLVYIRIMDGEKEYELVGEPKKYYKKRVYKKRVKWGISKPQSIKEVDITWVKDLALDLKQARIQAGLSQKTLGHKIGTNQAAISRFELGKENASVKFLEKLARTLGRKISITVD